MQVRVSKRERQREIKRQYAVIIIVAILLSSGTHAVSNQMTTTTASVGPHPHSLSLSLSLSRKGQPRRAYNGKRACTYVRTAVVGSRRRDCFLEKPFCATRRACITHAPAQLLSHYTYACCCSSPGRPPLSGLRLVVDVVVVVGYWVSSSLSLSLSVSARALL